MGADAKFYYRGAEIQINDIVRTPAGTEGVVEKIIHPGSEASAAYSCPDGGVLIRDPVGMGYFVMVMPYGSDWEDTDFIRREAVAPIKGFSEDSQADE